MWPASWIPHPSSFYCSDINLFLTGYAWCKLFNKSLLLFENNSRSLTLEEKYCCIYYNLKRQIKSQTSYTCKVFLLTWIFQYTGNFFFFFFLVIKKLLKALFPFIPWLLNFSDYGLAIAQIWEKYTLRRGSRGWTSGISLPLKLNIFWWQLLMTTYFLFCILTS